MVGKIGYYVEDVGPGVDGAPDPFFFFYMGDEAPIDQFILIDGAWEPLHDPWFLADKLMNAEVDYTDDPTEGVPPAPPSRAATRAEKGPATFSTGYYRRPPAGRGRIVSRYFAGAQPPDGQYREYCGQWTLLPDGFYLADLIAMGLVEGPFDDPPDGVPPFEAGPPRRPRRVDAPGGMTYDDL